MNTKKFYKQALLAMLAIGSFTMNSCRSSEEVLPVETSVDKYVLITLSGKVANNKPGFISAFDEFPTGTISNSHSGSLEGLGMGGWRVYENTIFKKFRTTDNTTGIEKLNIAADGTVTTAAFIASKDASAAAKYFGTGNFVIKDDNLGYYWDAAEPTKIQKFDPVSMKNIGSIDYTSVVNERGTDVNEIKFRSIGQKFLAVKNGKLFANITYAKNDVSQIGFFDDYYPDVYLAVIDLATEKYEKTIRIKDTGAIAYINENRMFDYDDNGDLYIVTQGVHSKGLGGKSKISRIKANETEIDPTWELAYDTDAPGTHLGKFTNVFAKNGKLIVAVNTEALTGGPNGNINTKDIWKIYSVDIASKQFTAIEGIPVGTNPRAAQVAEFVDGKIYLRSAPLDGVNGYYEYNPATHSAKIAFSVNVGGEVSGFCKIKVK